MEKLFITHSNLQAIVAELLNDKVTVISPDEDGKNYRPLLSADNFLLRYDTLPTSISLKEYYFPRTEPVFFFRNNNSSYELVETYKEQRIVALGIKPCDASAIPTLAKVFNWDYKDDFFNYRVKNITIIGVSCRKRDEYCFCESVGINPEEGTGCDVLLIPAGDAGFFADPITEKGSEFLDSFQNYFEQRECENSFTPPLEKPVFNIDTIKNWLDNNFTSDLWNSIGEVCLGCAKCSFTCPACHCFDIVDESCGYNCGRRMKNWDTCQSPVFTKHASGHNPRETQAKRFRQRIYHKFKYYPEKFGEILCTGCGRCSRGCPAGIDIREILSDINEMAAR